MSIGKDTQYGAINISDDAIATVAGTAAIACYGIVGLASRGSIRDVITELLKQDNYAKGVVVSKEKGGYVIDVYVVVAYEVKITEVLSEVQKKVRYELEKTFALHLRSVNVYAHSLRKIA